eukprot:351290-Chlamydomonas_euryale.AAC.8
MRRGVSSWPAENVANIASAAASKLVCATARVCGAMRQRRHNTHATHAWRARHLGVLAKRRCDACMAWP